MKEFLKERRAQVASWAKAVGTWFGVQWPRAKSLPRPALLLIVVGTTLAAALALDGLNGWQVRDKVFYPDQGTVAAVRFWTALVYALAFAMGLPAAFLLWHWRDRNVRDGIENSRKDINLKEFQEVQLRAAGALDEKLPEEAREQLQIAALHQLRGFLRGEYGDSFRRPAFELLMAGHAAAIHRIGVPEVQRQIGENPGRFNRTEIRNAAKACRAKLTRVDHERMLIIRDEFQHIFSPGFPLVARRFDMLDLQHKQFAKGLVLRLSHFLGADLFDAHLDGANLFDAHLEGATLWDAHLHSADLSRAHLEGATLWDAHLEDADLTGVHLEGATLWDTHLEGAKLRRAHFEGASLRRAHLERAELQKAYFNGADLQDAKTDEHTGLSGARFDAATQFGNIGKRTDWADLPESEKEAARAPWIARGAINVDAPQPE